MKAYVCLTFIAAALLLQVAETAVVHHEPIDLETALKTILKSFQRVMPCGLKSLHIPPLAPFYIEHINFNDSNYDYNAQISNLYIEGLDNVQILHMSLNNVTNQVKFDVIFKGFQILAEFVLENILSLKDFPIHFSGEGVINNKFEDVRFVGDFILSPTATGLKIDDCIFRFYLGNVAIHNFNSHWDNSLNNFFNNFIGEGISVWAQQVQKRLDFYVSNLLLPVVNKKLSKITQEAAVVKLLDFIVLLEMVNCTKS